ncbi:MAG: hypothetical protein CL912_08450 [Deltaproteobacteria bacterium]|nr:hypothetical protein [Deltaproteobacteria bacterium]
MYPDVDAYVGSERKTLLESDLDSVGRVLWNNNTSTFVTRLWRVRVARLFVLVKVNARDSIERWLHESDFEHAIVWTKDSHDARDEVRRSLG